MDDLKWNQIIRLKRLWKMNSQRKRLKRVLKMNTLNMVPQNMLSWNIRPRNNKRAQRTENRQAPMLRQRENSKDIRGYRTI